MAGGVISAQESGRVSGDIDLFNDTPDLTLQTYAEDRALLTDAGYSVDAHSPRPGFVRARVTKGRDTIGIDWAHELSWHFYQTIESDEAGFELHWADAATNKVLAMASRAEIRDGYDVLFWHRNPISLGALIWAAAGKDLGMTPGLILEEMRRNARISPGELAALQTVSKLDAQWFGMGFREAMRLVPTICNDPGPSAT